VENLKRYIQQHIQIDDLQLQTILNEFQLKKLSKGRHILKQGQVAGEYIFLESGCLRIYYFRNDKEVTGWVTTQHYFFTDLASLTRQVPSLFNIQAFEESIVYGITKQNMEALYATIPAWQEFGRKVWEAAFINTLDTLVSHQVESAEERYQRLLDEEPDLLQAIPLKHLATYIGITPNSLSRIRKQNRDEGKR